LTHSWGLTQAQSMGLEWENSLQFVKRERKESHAWQILPGNPQ